MAEDVIYAVEGNVATLTINRPERRNAINEGVIAGLGVGLARAADDADVRVVVLTGAGEKAFCAGADLGNAISPQTSRTSHPFADLLRVARSCPVPLVARVNGACMAGGMGLLAICDMAVAADHAVFGLPEVKVGLFPMQVLAVLMPLISARDLAELCFTGEPVDALAAERMRLVNYTVPAAHLDEKTAWLTARIADKSPTALRRGRQAMAAVSDMAFSQALSFLEKEIAALAASEDAAEGIAAFTQKRPPRWSGR